MRPYEKVQATFKPKRTDDLKPDAVKYIGRSGVFEALWKMGEDDPQEYEGMFAMRVPDEWETKDFIWVPECDLEIAGTCTDQ